MKRKKGVGKEDKQEKLDSVQEDQDQSTSYSKKSAAHIMFNHWDNRLLIQHGYYRWPWIYW